MGISVVVRSVAGAAQLTVDVISDEQTSQTYLMPPSVPRVPVFFLITPIVPHQTRAAAAEVRQAADPGETAKVWLCTTNARAGDQRGRVGQRGQVKGRVGGS